MTRGLLMVFSLIHFHSWSQEFEAATSEVSPEKIYLQLDRQVYANDKIIWFKSIVTNAADHAPTQLSGILYVEFIGPNKKVLEKKLIKLEKGLGNGFFKLNRSKIKLSFHKF